jgi:acetyl esterase/lipase
MLNESLWRALPSLGSTLTPAAAQATMQALAPCHDAVPPQGLELMLHRSYGPHPRQALDVFSPAEQHPSHAVLVFVHGGGFVSGDKNDFGPFYGNIGRWVARQGLTGVNINYRLAPDHPWPAACDDIHAALQWLAHHLTPGLARPVVLMGHSAGASHVAGWVARHGASAGPLGVAGVILVSGLYDLAAVAPTPGRVAYFGIDAADRVGRSPLAALANAQLPVLVACAELDPPETREQAARLVAARSDRLGGMPQVLVAQGHNHFSTVLQLDAFETGWSAALRAFIHDRVPSPACA